MPIPSDNHPETSDWFKGIILLFLWAFVAIFNGAKRQRIKVPTQKIPSEIPSPLLDKKLSRYDDKKLIQDELIEEDVLEKNLPPIHKNETLVLEELVVPKKQKRQILKKEGIFMYEIISPPVAFRRPRI